MFKFIQNQRELFQEAAIFVGNEMPDVEITTDSVLVVVNSFPCLVDMLVKYDWTGGKIFGAHVCNRNIAKCLVYPKTNKLTSMSWHIVQNIENTPGIIRASIAFSDRFPIVKADGFHALISGMKEDEPFLMSAQTFFSREKINKIYVSLVNLALAKRLVYHKKNESELRAIRRSKFRKTYDQNRM